MKNKMNKGNKMKNKKSSSGLAIEAGSLTPPCPMTCALDHSAMTPHTIKWC